LVHELRNCNVISQSGGFEEVELGTYSSELGQTTPTSSISVCDYTSRCHDLDISNFYIKNARAILSTTSSAAYARNEPLLKSYNNVTGVLELGRNMSVKYYYHDATYASSYMQFSVVVAK